MSDTQLVTATTAPSRIKISWPRAVAWAAGVIYAPQLVMCLYTLAFVSCSHCKKAVWMAGPIAPGIFCGALARHFVELPRGSVFVEVMIAGVLSPLTVAGVAACLRVAGRWRWLVMALTLVAASFLARAMLGLVQS